jgi:hypothetical protein
MQRPDFVGPFLRVGVIFFTDLFFASPYPEIALGSWFPERCGSEVCDGREE